MTDYAKAALRVLYSEDASYTDPEWVTNWPDVELTPTHGYAGSVELDTGGTTIVQASEIYTALTLVAILNTEASGGNKITIAWTDNGANANDQDIPPGGLLVIPDVNGAVAVVGTATTASVIAKFVAVGT